MDIRDACSASCIRVAVCPYRGEQGSVCFRSASVRFPRFSSFSTVVSFSMAADTVSTLRLPSELTDRILDFLHDDRHALASCALTCHNWLPTARLHLFRTLSKIPLQDVVPLEQLLEEDPPLGSYIDRLELGRPDNFRAGRLFAKPPLLHLGILERCRMPNLRKLILCEVAVESFAPLVRCLFSQPALEELAIRATLFCEDYENLRSANVNKPKSVHIVVPMDTAAPLALRSLEIVTLTWRFPHTILPDTLIAMHRYLDLKEIVLDVPTKGLRHWAQALQILSGTITNLKLTVQDTDESEFGSVQRSARRAHVLSLRPPDGIHARRCPPLRLSALSHHSHPLLRFTSARILRSPEPLRFDSCAHRPALSVHVATGASPAQASYSRYLRHLTDTGHRALHGSLARTRACTS